MINIVLLQFLYEYNLLLQVEPDYKLEEIILTI